MKYKITERLYNKFKKTGITDFSSLTTGKYLLFHQEYHLPASNTTYIIRTVGVYCGDTVNVFDETHNGGHNISYMLSGNRADHVFFQRCI